MTDMDAASQPLDSQPQSQPREYRLQFTGTGREYFSIWIVNLLLSIVTLGIYSAWAKVRREQYFHRNTLLDEQPFDYTGNPRSILLGRVLALAVIAAGSALQKISVELALGVTAFFALIYPWVIVRSARFRARNTRYRNIAFHFTGTTWTAIKVYFWLYIIFVPFVATSIWLGPQLQAMQTQGKNPDPHLASQIGLPLSIAMFVTLALLVALWPLYLCRIKSFLHRSLRYGNAQGEFDGRAGVFYRALIRVSGYSILAFVLIGIVGGAAFALHQPWLLIFAYLFLLLPSVAYRVLIANVSFSHASIGGQRFASDMQVSGYLMLSLTNLLLLIFTLGLAWPWAQVRAARYRLEHLSIFATPDSFDNIVGEAQQNPAAFGEEVADFMDFDLSL